MHHSNSITSTLHVNETLPRAGKVSVPPIMALNRLHLKHTIVEKLHSDVVHTVLEDGRFNINSNMMPSANDY